MLSPVWGRWARAGRMFAGGLLTSMVTAGAAPAVAQEQQAAPNFAPNPLVGWVGVGGNGPSFASVPGHVRPIYDDPAHPFVPNGIGRQPSFRIADVNNPNFKPWVKASMKKDNDEVLAGKVAFTAHSSCEPAGVPGFMVYGGPNPVYFVQTPKEVVMIYSGDEQFRHVYLDVRHSAHPKPSWYGESVGHYEGNTLVIDTVGLNDKTVLDTYRTPHSDKLHVVERWNMIDGGKAMDMVVMVEDPEAFNEPWWGRRRYNRSEQEATEIVCAENNQHLFDYHIPVATTPDF
jgi:hypothetical protein